MKKLLSIAVVLILLSSCGGGYNPPTNPGGYPSGGNTGNTNSGSTNNSGNSNNGGNSGGSTYDPTPAAGFTYKTYHPFIVSFTNTSMDADSYSWDFGDGTTSREEHPTHAYDNKGVYKVTLKAFRNGKSDTYSCNVTVIAPTKCYVTKIIYDQVPKNNEYYNIRCTDDYFLFETLYWNTNWVLLSTANLPYEYTLKTKRQVDFSTSEYVIRLYQSSTGSDSGTQLYSWELSTSEIKNKYPTKYNLSAKNTKLSVIFGYE